MGQWDITGTNSMKKVCIIGFLAMFALSAFADERRVVPRSMKCSKCNGTGEVVLRRPARASSTGYAEYTRACSQCDGTGRIYR